MRERCVHACRLLLVLVPVLLALAPPAFAQEGGAPPVLELPATPPDAPPAADDPPTPARTPTPAAPAQPETPAAPAATPQEPAAEEEPAAGGEEPAAGEEAAPAAPTAQQRTQARARREAAARRARARERADAAAEVRGRADDGAREAALHVGADARAGGRALRGAAADAAAPPEGSSGPLLPVFGIVALVLLAGVVVAARRLGPPLTAFPGGAATSRWARRVEIGVAAAMVYLLLSTIAFVALSATVAG